MGGEMREIYEELRQYFNTGQTTRLRKTEDLMKILEMLFTSEQAEHAMSLPLTAEGRVSPDQVAEKMNKPLQEVKETLEAMAREGKILATTSRKDGRKYYALFPLLPGILESTYADGIDSDKRRQLSKLIERYISEGLWSELASSNYPQFRIIPINNKVDAASHVLAFEEVSNIVLSAGIITVIPCHCRAVSRTCNHILEADFVFGAWADYLINYRGARRWSTEDALQRLKECEEDGLIHLTGNAQVGSTVICNCCSCCCMVLRGLTELHNPRSFVRSNFEPTVDHKECTLCMKCQKICPMSAITKLPGYETNGSDTRILIQESQCVGCGLCSTHCPVDAITMVKVRDYFPVKSLAEMNERYVKEKLY
jgi:Pyruvate/2-oxoacid:ferredoxin oxidoreductase delta subunit